MIDPTHKLPITQQAKLAGISRGSVYYLPRPDKPEDLELMRQIDRLYLEHPFMGSRQLRDQIHRLGYPHVGRDRVRGPHEADGRRSPVSETRHQQEASGTYGLSLSPARTIHPGSQPGLGTDTTYIPMAKGFVYLTCVIDWASRKVLGRQGRPHSGSLPCRRCTKSGLYPLRATGHHQHGSGVASSPPPTSLKQLTPKAAGSAWMAKGPGGTMSLSSASGNH